MPVLICNPIKSPTCESDIESPEELDGQGSEAIESSFSPEGGPQLFYEDSNSSVKLAKLMDMLPMHPMSEYTYMWDINNFVPIESEGEDCDELSPLFPSSQESGTSQALYQVENLHLSSMSHMRKGM